MWSGTFPTSIHNKWPKVCSVKLFLHIDMINLVSLTGIYYLLMIMYIPSGVMFQNEKKLDEMSKIMEVLHIYVPTKASDGQLHLSNESTLPYDNTTFFEILLGGDQLKVARAAGVQDLFKGHKKALEHLEGLTPVEDWHTRIILLEVSKTNCAQLMT